MLTGSASANCESASEKSLSRVSAFIAIAHAAHLSPEQFGSLANKIRELIGRLRCRLTDDHDIQDHSLLRFLVGQEAFPGKTRDVASRQSDGIEHVFEIVGLTQAFLFRVHTGNASLSTCSRNLPGKSPGVSTSTGMPSASSSSN